MVPPPQTSSIACQPSRFFKNSSRKLAKMAGHVAFGLSRATLQVKRGLTPSEKLDKSSQEDVRTPGTIRRRKTNNSITRQRVLFAHLSSVDYVLADTRLRCPLSAPNLHTVFNQQPVIQRPTLSDLTDDALLNIAKFLDGTSVLRLSHVDRRFREVCLKNIPILSKKKVHTFEIVIDYSNELQSDVVRAVKKNRSINSRTEVVASSLSSLLPPVIKFLGQVTVNCSKIQLHKWLCELTELFDKRQAIPTALSFVGGTSGKLISPIGLLDVDKFVSFVGMFYPFLKEINLCCPLLRINSTSDVLRLLSLFSLVPLFGVVYDNNVICSQQHLIAAAKYWQTDVLAQNSEVRIRKPPDFEHVDWVGLADVDDSSKITVEHRLISKLTLVFFFI